MRTCLHARLFVQKFMYIIDIYLYNSQNALSDAALINFFNIRTVFKKRALVLYQMLNSMRSRAFYIW